MCLFVFLVWFIPVEAWPELIGCSSTSLFKLMGDQSRVLLRDRAQADFNCAAKTVWLGD